ncbi:MAG: threonine--tRNA ligase [Patescibacteria group bacterium]|nr:threonine--tRNA ligase [Patescibacteria group bacterium]
MDKSDSKISVSPHSNQRKSVSLEAMRHSCSHLMAMAVLQIFPKAKLAIGPAIDNGFYYDFELNRSLIPQDLKQIEKIMHKIKNHDFKFEKQEWPIKKALDYFKKHNQPYKVELIKDLASDNKKLKTVSIYISGEFIDLCAGPHIKSTKEIGPFKLLSIAGAYWRGDEKNKMLTRIYGTCFDNEKDLEQYLWQAEEAKKRDHKKIGQELDLFSFHSEAPGAAFWHPKGMIIWNLLEQYGKSIRQHYGYQEIQTPILAKQILWETSGHWEHYKDSMFYFKVENTNYCIKPMDCPFNIKIYQTKPRSYKELPVRYTEIGRIMRNEKSGELNGLFRVRHLTQDDSHIFLSENQIKKEIGILIKMAKSYYKTFGITPKFNLSTRPDDFMGDIKTWDKAEKDLKNVLQAEKVDYKIKEGDGAFYGPKIDIDIEDALGRPWQLATIQLDFQLPGRFKIEYVDNIGTPKTPVLIHAAIFGISNR